jgi:hypothetical protein
MKTNGESRKQRVRKQKSGGGIQESADVFTTQRL